MSSRDKEKHNKIRKRDCNSSSSTSSFSSSRRYRFKRAILVGKKSGYTTPAPVWKTTTSSPSMANHHHRNSFGSKEKEISVTARKLAATLWEINDLPTSGLNNRTTKHRDRASNLCRSESDPSYTPFSEVKQRIKGFEVDGSKGRGSDLSLHQLHLAHYYLKGVDGPCNADLIEKGSINKAKDRKNCGKCTVGEKSRLKEAKSGLSTLNKLLKVLSQMSLQEQHSSSMPLILAMGTELNHVRNQIDHLIKEQSSSPNDIEYLMNQFAEEKNAWKRREREKIREATMNIAKELEVEKKLRRQTERLNEKIAKEMANVKTLHLKMSKELEREKRAKEILEQICDELAKGIGEDRAQVEELKRESAKVREEVEKEREMLQLADNLREERVHMKLSEAKYQFEEKNAVLENLKSELQSFFKSKEVEEKSADIINPRLQKLKDLELCLNNTCLGIQNLEEDNDLNVGYEVEHEDDSGESDLQSIELNMDNDNKSYKWSYEAKRVSVDRDIGRRSISDWGSICFNKGNVNGKKRDFLVNIQGSSDQLERERSIEFLFEDQIGKDKEESESYRPIMSLQDYISLPNNALESGQQLTLQCIDGENVLALEGNDLKQEAARRK